MSNANAIVAARVKGKLSFEAEVWVELFDFGNFLGVAVVLTSGRHAMRVKIDDNDLTAAADSAADALNEWASTTPAGAVNEYERRGVVGNLDGRGWLGEAHKPEITA